MIGVILIYYLGNLLNAFNPALINVKLFDSQFKPMTYPGQWPNRNDSLPGPMAPVKASDSPGATAYKGRWHYRGRRVNKLNPDYCGLWWPMPVITNPGRSHWYTLPVITNPGRSPWLTLPVTIVAGSRVFGCLMNFPY